MKNESAIKVAKNLLIIQTAFIGDTALSLFLAQAIKNINPNCSVCFLTTPVSAEFVAKAECVSRVFTLDKRGTEKRLSAVKTKVAEINSALGEIDIVASLHRSARTSILVSRLNAKIKAGFSSSALSHVYNKKIKYYPCLHEIAKNAEFLFALGEPETINIFPKVKFNRINITIDLDESGRKKYCVVAPGSVWETKRWKPEYFKELVGLIADKGFVPLVTGSKSEYETAQFVASGNDVAINLAGKISLSETIEIMRHSEFVVCNDSAPTHLSALAGTKSLTIYGATSPMFGFYPLGNGSKFIEAGGLKCHPCEIHGSHRCPLNFASPQCIETIKPEEAIKLLGI